MACSRTLTGWSVQVVEADGRGHLRGHGAGRDHGQLLRRDAHDELGQQRRELRLEAGLPGRHPPRRGHPLGEGVCDVLEGAVLQQAREQQVAGLDQGEVLLVLRAQLRQQPRGLDVQQRGGHQQELRGLAEVPLLLVRPVRLDVGDELVGHLGQRDLGDVELVLGDEAQKQVEGSREHVEVHLEGRAPGPSRDDTARGERRVGRPSASTVAGLSGRCVRLAEHGSLAHAQAAPPRAMSSRANCRYAAAAPWVDA